jgi:hypothetical protein
LASIVIDDPATLHVCGTATTCTSGVGGETNLIGGTFSIIQESSGKNLLGPMGLFFAIPVYSGKPAPTFNVGMVTDAHIEGSTTPLTIEDDQKTAAWFTNLPNHTTNPLDSEGFWAIGGSHDLYQFLGIGGSITGSLNPDALKQDYTNNNISTTGLLGWDVFDISVLSELSKGGAMDFKDTLPFGTFIAPFAKENQSGNHFDSTQNTNVGLVTTKDATPVPLPGALPLMAGGLAGIGAFSRWRKRYRVAS